MKTLYPLLLLIFTCSACANEGNKGKEMPATGGMQPKDTVKGTPGTYYERYAGTAGNRNIVLNLVKYQHFVAATYYNLSDNRPVMLLSYTDTVAAPDELFFKEGKNGEITWHLKAIDGRLLGGTTNNEQVNLSPQYPAGSSKMITYCLDDTGRLLKNFAAPKADAAYGILWPAGSWEEKSAAFVKANLAADMKLDATTGAAAGLQDRAAKYFETYRNELRALVDSTWPAARREDPSYHYSATFYQQVIYNDQYWLVIKSLTGTYTGGAHGMYNSTFQNLDLKNFREWHLAELVADTAALRPYAELALRDYFGIKSNEDLSSRLLVNEVPITANFYLTQTGITLVYNPYELASYADGEVQLFLSFEKIMPLLTPDFKKRMSFSAGIGVALNTTPEKALTLAPCNLNNSL